MKKRSNNTNLSKKYTGWIALLVVLIFFALLSPIIITGTKSLYFFPENAERIATIIGIMSPFIAIGMIVVTYLAFKMQLDANKELFKNSQRQQLEHQFYEMLKIHCDNVKNLHANSLHKSFDADNYSQKKCLWSRIFLLFT